MGILQRMDTETNTEHFKKDTFFNIYFTFDIHIENALNVEDFFITFLFPCVFKSILFKNNMSCTYLTYPILVLVNFHGRAAESLGHVQTVT